ncbi:MAG: DUF2066 domain-containing protein [Magnetococcales bacterium]|nr:DUF2066 domain-containing protein [Magnetococcales bacterium]
MTTQWRSTILASCFVVTQLASPVTVWAQEQDNYFSVKQIVVRVPQSVDPNKNPRASGMIEAQKIAFKRLQVKLFPENDKQSRAIFIKDIQQNIKDFMHRTIIVAEHKSGRDLELTVDVYFDKEKLRNSLNTAGISFCEAPYPKVLYIFDEQIAGSPEAKVVFASFIKAGHVFGTELVQPIRDVEDLTNLSFPGDPSIIPQSLNWARERYQTNKIWRVSADGFTSSVSATSSSGSMSRWKVAEYDQDGINFYFMKLRDNNKENKVQKKSDLIDSAVLSMVTRIVNPWIASHVGAVVSSPFVDVTIVNASDLDGIDQLTRQIQGLSGVAKVSILELSSDNVKLRLVHNGNMAEVKEQLIQMGAVDVENESGMLIVLP